MGNQEDNYENDPYIQQSQHNNAIKHLYSNQGLSSVSHGDSIVDMKQLSEQQEKRQTVAYQNPIKVDRNSIKLEQDAYEKNMQIFISTQSLLLQILIICLHLHQHFEII